jgi:hypothetical protein
MAAGLGFKNFATGEVLTAADVNNYLMQNIWVFASAAARDAAVTSPQEGNACYLKDTNQVLTYSGSAWVAVGGSSGSGLTLISSTTIGTTVTSVTVSSAFSSTYDNYLIIVSGGVFSTDANMNVQLGSTTSGYFWTGYYMGPTSATVNGDNGNSQASFRYAVGGDTTSAAGMFTLIGPNLAKPTVYVADGWRGTSNKTYTNYRGSETSSTQHTAFTLNVEGGNTATGGTIKVYGYANS